MHISFISNDWQSIREKKHRIISNERIHSRLIYALVKAVPYSAKTVDKKPK